MNKYIQAAGLTIVLSACGGEYPATHDSDSLLASDGIGPFYNCFELDYHDKVNTPDEAYHKGECFMSLAKGDNLLGQRVFNEADVGADQHTLLQYANSWLLYATTKGHSLAEYHLAQNQTALASISGAPSYGRQDEGVMLAYERLFNLLDIDGNGYLNLKEAQTDRTLARSFASFDFDDNGRISLGEYVISSSEATAAGNQIEADSLTQKRTE
jgi:hypothetical protein